MTGSRYRVAVLGAGNGGQAVAAALALEGHEVRLWNRTGNRLAALSAHREIRLVGALTGTATLALVTGDLAEAVRGAQVILIVTTANAHEPLARALAELLEDGQIILLNPGRTGGALEVRRVLKTLRPEVRSYVAEAQSLVYACRLEGPGVVRVIGIKEFVPVAAVPVADTRHVVGHVAALFSSFTAAANALETSFENIGAIFHPAVVLFNAAAIERKTPFYFYQDMTPHISEFLVALDAERLALGRAYGLELVPIVDWIKKAYPQSRGDTLCDRMRSNPAYNEIRAPDTLDSRLLTEDIPTGLVPFIAFGRAAGLDLPIMRALVQIASTLLRRDFEREGRTLERMGLSGRTAGEIIRDVCKDSAP